MANKINKIVTNEVTYELQDYELNNKLSSFSGIVKNASGTLSKAVAGTDYDYPVLKGTGAPTTSTVGSVGQRYVNTSATTANGLSAEYVCTAVSGSTYTWVDASGQISAHNSNASAHSDIRAAISTAQSIAESAQAIAEGLAATSYNITLTTTGWVADTTFSDYGYKYSYSLSGITADDIAELYLDASSVIVANTSGMLSACETVSNAINFYATAIPTSNLTGKLIISSETPLGSSLEGINPNDYVSKTMIGVASGVASLDTNGKVPTTQLPVGQAGGVATLGADGKVPSSQLPTIGGHVVQSSEPSNTSLLWIDTGNGGILKYWNGSAWAAVTAIYS